MQKSRQYLSVSETGKIIASEVVETGSSKNWSEINENTLGIALELERHLSKFNIGITDSKTGTWSVKSNGSRYFSSLKVMGSARNKINSFISMMKKG